MPETDHDQGQETEQEVPADAETTDATDDTAGGEGAEETDPLAAAEAEALKWRDVAMRTAADLDNYRKRAAKDKTDAIRYANTALLEDLLPVIDNFEWGLQAAAEDTGSPIYQGMNMVFKQITDFLAAQGAEQIDAAGQPFDPNLHEAVSQEPSDTVPEGHVITQTRKGYRVSGRLLRPAAVTVSQGPAAPAADGDA